MLSVPLLRPMPFDYRKADEMAAPSSAGCCDWSPKVRQPSPVEYLSPSKGNIRAALLRWPWMAKAVNK